MRVCLPFYINVLFITVVFVSCIYIMENRKYHDPDFNNIYGGHVNYPFNHVHANYFTNLPNDQKMGAKIILKYVFLFSDSLAGFIGAHLFFANVFNVKSTISLVCFLAYAIVRILILITDLTKRNIENDIRRWEFEQQKIEKEEERQRKIDESTKNNEN